MPLYDYECKKCGDRVEVLLSMEDAENFTVCSICEGEMVRVLTKAPSFKLKYNPKTDMVDWEGNHSRYWDDYKAKKEAGQKPRIPELDGQ